MLNGNSHHEPKTATDHKQLAAHLMEIAYHLRPDQQPTADISLGDPQLRELRKLLVGREIDELARLTDEVENPEQLATAVGRVLPVSIALASNDPRLARVLVPALERAAENSIRNDPQTLANILYPLILPAIRKSIGESIEETYQSINETLKQSFSLRGLRWRLESWRTGVPYAQVVMRHTLVYQVEHVFLIHRNNGMLISHVAADNAAGQDPQLVSAMLSAIQDFVKDSFQSTEQQGLDTLRLGDLKVWSEIGPYATLVAVIRGNPPETLRGIMGNVLARIHAERPKALERFDGDSSGFQDVEAALKECLKQGEAKRPRVGMPLVLRLCLLAGIGAASLWMLRWWEEQSSLTAYVAQLKAQPGIVITQTEQRDGKFVLTGMRDPLAADPRAILHDPTVIPHRYQVHIRLKNLFEATLSTGGKSGSQILQPSIDNKVVLNWTSYEALHPDLILKRVLAALAPPTSVKIDFEGGKIVARGAATVDWLNNAQEYAKSIPAGSPPLDVSGVVNTDAEQLQRWQDYVASLKQKPGIVITRADRADRKFYITGLRDPLAVDPIALISDAGLDPHEVVSSWVPYQALDPEFILKRLRTSLSPLEGVTLSVKDGQIVAEGSATRDWLERARFLARTLPAGAPGLDLSRIRDLDEEAFSRLRDAIEKVRGALQSRSIYFDFKIALPAPGQEPLLDSIAGELRELAALSSRRVRAKVTITGHSDFVGEGTFNLALSVARAEAVRALLKKRGVNPDLLAVRGAGPLEPVAPGDSKAAQAANRRVSLSVEIEEQ